MRVSGSTLNSTSHITSSEIFYVWGEWTGPAKLYYIKDSKPKKLNVMSSPNCIVEPCADFSRNQYVDYQMSDVDPWIFSVFNYTLCKQANLEFMSKLVKGDVIYFGTGTNEEMVLDTVFVVGEFLDTDDMTEKEYREYLGGERLLGASSSSRGEETMSKEWKAFCERKSPHTGEYLKVTQPGCKYPVASRIYKGATYDNQVNGMFSYSVANREVDGGGEKNRHAKLVVTDVMEKMVKNNLATYGAQSGKNMKFKPNAQLTCMGKGSEVQIKAGFDSMLQKVFDEGRVAGIRVALPAEPPSTYDDKVELSVTVKGELLKPFEKRFF